MEVVHPCRSTATVCSSARAQELSETLWSASDVDVKSAQKLTECRAKGMLACGRYMHESVFKWTYLACLLGNTGKPEHVIHKSDVLPHVLSGFPCAEQ